MAADTLACFLHDILKIEKHSYLREEGHWMMSPSRSLINLRLRFGDAGEITALYAGVRATVSESRTVEI